MEKVAIVTDTNCGLRPEEAASMGIHLIPMPVILDGKTYFEYVSISPEEFFERLKNGAKVSTSQPAPGTLLECWNALLQVYAEIVYIPMSSGLSGSCHTAAMLAQDYPGQVWVADIRRISVTQRQAALEAAALARQGKYAPEITAHLERNMGNSDIFIAVNTLELLKKSGRVTATGAAMGSILSLKPVLRIQGGKLDAYRRVRGMGAAMRTMVEGIQLDKESFGYPNITLRAAYAGDRQAGKNWQKVLQEAFPECVVGLDPLPLSICCHVGYGALGVGVTGTWIP